MIPNSLNTLQLILISLSIGFLSHHIFVFIPQQTAIIEIIDQFKTQFSIFYKVQQFNIIKVVGLIWLLDVINNVLLLKKKTNKSNHYFNLASFGLLIIGFLSLGIDLAFQLMLFNGYHVFAYNTSNIIHWALLCIWIIRFIITLIQIKTCKSNI